MWRRPDPSAGLRIGAVGEALRPEERHAALYDPHPRPGWDVRGEAVTRLRRQEALEAALRRVHLHTPTLTPPPDLSAPTLPSRRRDAPLCVVGGRVVVREVVRRAADALRRMLAA